MIRSERKLPFFLADVSCGRNLPTTVNPEVAGSSPVEPAIKSSTYKTRRTGLFPTFTRTCTTSSVRRVGRELLRPLPKHPFVHDGVAAVDALGLVAGHLHCRGPRDAGPLQVPHRRAPEVVGDAPRIAGVEARGPPRLVLILDRAPVAVEHPGNHSALGPLERLCGLSLGLQAGAELGSYHEGAPVVVLRVPHVEPEGSRVKIHRR
jgi:hypothetical protein